MVYRPGQWSQKFNMCSSYFLTRKKRSTLCHTSHSCTNSALLTWVLSYSCGYVPTWCIGNSMLYSTGRDLPHARSSPRISSGAVTVSDLRRSIPQPWMETVSLSMLVYRVINNVQDCEHMQQSINNIGRWVDENNLHLNSSKCKVMVVTKRRTKATPIPVWTGLTESWRIQVPQHDGKKSFKREAFSASLWIVFLWIL